MECREHRPMFGEAWELEMQGTNHRADHLAGAVSPTLGSEDGGAASGVYASMDTVCPVSRSRFPNDAEMNTLSYSTL
jgi:hypothetical protein